MPTGRFFRTQVLLLFIPLFAIPYLAHGQNLSPTHQFARDVFQQLIEINTTDTPDGNVTAAAEAMAARFRTAGFAESDIKVLGPVPNKGNLIVRLRGRGKDRPILFIGHLDVVQALPQDWSMDPFKLHEV